MTIDQSQTCKLTFGLLNLQFSFAANVAVLIIVVVGLEDVDVGVGDGASNTIEMTCRRIQEEFGMGLMNDSVFHD